MQAKVEMAMDGARSGDPKLEFNDSNKHYLFWVNDNCDATSYKYFENNYLVGPALLVEDDQQDGDKINLVPIQTRFSDQIVVHPNCNDNKINGLRDLEDFTRLHIRIDASTAAFPGVTYWMRFEAEDPKEQPVVNLFQAVDPTMNYLIDPETARKQVNATEALSVGSEEVELPGKYIHTGGAVAPFLLEGAAEGKGRLILTAKLNETDIGQASIELELRAINTFYDKYVVKVGEYNVVQDHPDLVRAGTYTSINPTDEYCLYVHGWNMAEWEKDRWAETTLKRLWWLGYCGRVGIFEWPTLEGKTTYDGSEQCLAIGPRLEAVQL
jgi:hypothetical protein